MNSKKTNSDINSELINILNSNKFYEAIDSINDVNTLNSIYDELKEYYHKIAHLIMDARGTIQTRINKLGEMSKYLDMTREELIAKVIELENKASS